MKNLTVILLTLFTQQKVAAQTWSNVASITTPANTSLNGVSFVSPTLGITGGTYGSNGVLRKSYNAGLDWSQFSTTNNEQVNDVYFFSSTTGIVLTGSGMILHTTDGGTTFTIVVLGGFNNALKKVSFATATTGFAAGGIYGTIRKTTDAGLTWTQQFPATFMMEWRSVHAPTTSNAWVVGQDGTINVTSDGGTNWSAQTSPVSTMLQDVFFQNATTGIIVGNNGVILKTTNGGVNWNSITSGTTENLNAIEFVSATEGWIVGNSGTMLHTTDGGDSWTSFTSNTTEHLLDVDFLHPFLGLACGANGTMIRYVGNCTETNAVTHTSCGSYVWGGQLLTASGVYNHTFINQLGCDSTVTLNLTVLPVSPAHTITASACDSYTLNDTTYTTGGTHTQHLTSANGCDSVIQLTLSLSYTPAPGIIWSGIEFYANPSTGGALQWVDCDNGNSPIIGQTGQNFLPTVSGNYAVTETNSCGQGISTCIQFCVGANSSVTSNGNTLTANQANATYQWIDCDNGNAPVAGQTNQSFTATQSGNYAVEITYNGCTSTSTCINVCMVDATVTINGATITANQSGATYQWLDCDNGSQPIPGANAQSFTATQSGNYAVSVMLGICQSTSSCQSVTVLGIDDNPMDNLLLYPNPAAAVVTIENLEIGSMLQITDITGKTVVHTFVYSKDMALDLSAYHNGVYIVQLTGNNGLVKSKRLIIHK